MIPACIKLCSLASGKGKRHEHAAPVRRGGAGQFEFGTTAASAGILRTPRPADHSKSRSAGYDVTMGIGVLNDSAIKTPKDRERRQMASAVTLREYPFRPAVSGHDGFDLSKVSIV
jgi:hypothetical protein